MSDPFDELIRLSGIKTAYYQESATIRTHVIVKADGHKKVGTTLTFKGVADIMVEEDGRYYSAIKAPYEATVDTSKPWGWESIKVKASESLATHIIRVAIAAKPDLAPS